MNTRWLAVAIVLGSAGGAYAQAQIIPKDDTLKGPGDKDVDGWNQTLGGAATINLVSNSNVVGQTDGFSTLFGIGVTGGADYTDGKHLLRNTLSVAESFARTPVVAEFVKTNDVVQLEGLYNYFAADQLGVFGRLALQTGLFPATDVRGTPTSWVVKPAVAGGPGEMLNRDAFRQRLAGSFSPFSINESAGVFAEPIHHDRLALSIRAGIGGRHTFADGVLVSDDDKATPEVDLVRLANVHQLGIEGFAGAQGKMKDGKVTYHAGFTLLVPFVNNDKYDRGVGTLTRIGVEGAVTINVFEWMSLVYSAAITRDAQLFPKDNELTQIQHSLLLTFKYTFVKKREKEVPKEPTEAEKELAAAKARAEDAEKARAAAETLAKDLQRKLDECTARQCAPTAPGSPAPVSPPAPDAPATPAPTTPAPATPVSPPGR